MRPTIHRYLAHASSQLPGRSTLVLGELAAAALQFATVRRGDEITPAQQDAVRRGLEAELKARRTAQSAVASNEQDYEQGEVMVDGVVVSEREGTAHEIQGAWDRVFSAWLPGSGYQPDDRPCYEVYRGNPMKASGGSVFRCEMCLPVRPL